MPVARAAFFATRLSPAPVLRIVRFADFTTFSVLDFLRLAIYFLLFTTSSALARSRSARRS